MESMFNMPGNNPGKWYMESTNSNDDIQQK